MITCSVTWIEATSSTVTLSADESPASPALEITSAAASPPLPSAMISVFTSSCRPSAACAADGGAGGGAVAFAVAFAGAGRSGVVGGDHHINLRVGGRRIDVLDRHLDFITRDLLPALLGDIPRERAAEGPESKSSTFSITSTTSTVSWISCPSASGGKGGGGGAAAAAAVATAVVAWAAAAAVGSAARSAVATAADRAAAARPAAARPAATAAGPS